MLNIFLLCYYYYNLIWEYIFGWLGEFMFIFYVSDDHNNLKNITWNYYLGFNLDEYTSGTYYLKIYNSTGTNHIAFNGNLADIHKKNMYQYPEKLPKRKNIILLDGDISVNIDLKILDNYKISTLPYDNSITNLGQILKLLDINCTHITIIQMRPFLKVVMDVEDVNINDLYQ